MTQYEKTPNFGSPEWLMDEGIEPNEQMLVAILGREGADERLAAWRRATADRILRREAPTEGT